ncbi:hypothetical protein EDD40_2067 [Saccharothrix texasensis]|uniref:Uncharacterized protein n=1 Tax=Saccharothrix texasensis TaxID=103734 RepID=A0A3N1H2Q9_9PSEU|nr:hypothetical protein EDD40_2067 [Saccharothrix texasensis]
MQDLTPYRPGVQAPGDHPVVVVARLGARPDQENVLLRLVLRHPTRTLTDDEADAARDAAHAAVHGDDQPLISLR